MTLIKILDGIREWCETEICPKVKLKLPNDNNNGVGYEYRLVNPAAFVLSVPAKDRLPPRVPAPVPSVCVQLMEGTDSLIEKTRQLKIRLCLSAWNPGEHGGDIFIPHKNETQLGGFHYRQWVGGEAAEHYERNAEGWRDLYNFADTALMCVHNAEHLAGTRIVKSAGITYGPFTDDDGAIWEAYPYWHSWILFTLECGVVQRTPPEYAEFL